MIDALVVGAGPAGSSAALRLARAGSDVVVLERARFPRTKVCGEYLSPGACAALADLDLFDAVAREGHPIARVVLAGFGSEPVSLRLPRPGAMALARSRFDELLLESARCAGARVISGTFLSTEEIDGGAEIRYRDDRGDEQVLRARSIVGADGAWSAVAQRTGLAGEQERKGRWAVGGHLRGQDDGDALEMYVGPGGYYARNPLGSGATNEMLVTADARTGDAAEQTVVQITGGRRSFDANALVKRVAVGPLRYAPHAITRGCIFLAGDAAGLLDPFVGQGIAIALETSRAVADAIGARLRGISAPKVARSYIAARRSAVMGRTLLASAVNAVIGTRFLRERAERAIKRDPAGAEAILAAVAGAVPAHHAFSPRAIAGLFA